MTQTPEPPSGGMFDKLKGKAKEVAGSVVGDDALAVEGKLEQEKAEAVGEARQKAAEAEHAKAQAEIRAEDGELAVQAEQEAERLRAQAAAARNTADFLDADQR